MRIDILKRELTSVMDDVTHCSEMLVPGDVLDTVDLEDWQRDSLRSELALVLAKLDAVTGLL